MHLHFLVLERHAQMEDLVHTLHFQMIWVQEDQQFLIDLPLRQLVPDHSDRNNKWGVSRRFQNNRLIGVLLIGVNLLHKAHFNFACQIVQRGYGLR